MAEEDLVQGAVHRERTRSLVTLWHDLPLTEQLSGVGAVSDNEHPADIREDVGPDKAGLGDVVAGVHFREGRMCGVVGQESSASTTSRTGPIEEDLDPDRDDLSGVIEAPLNAARDNSRPVTKIIVS